MGDNIHSLFGSLAKEKSEQSQKEAIAKRCCKQNVELLMMTMYVDKSLKLEEDEAIKRYIETLQWESPMSVEYYLGNATAKVRKALETPEKIQSFLEDISNRFETVELKKQVLQICSNLAMADSELSTEEQEFLQLVAQVFQVPAEG